MHDLELPWLTPTDRRRKWLVGVSGGADSVALLHGLHESKCRNLVVCHLHHGLRGTEADRDWEFVAGLAARLGYEFVGGRVDVRDAMKQCGESMETAARRERLEFFAMVSRKRRCRRVLLGHHADDQAETVLWNLLRGSHGLKGMNAESEIMISGTKLLLVRPLLHHRRQYLRDWLLMRGETWREDASNAEPVAIRNRLRSELLPLMEEIVGRDPVKAICRLAKDFSDWEEWANGQLRQQRLMDPQGRIHLGALRQLPETMQRMCVADYLRSQEVKGLSRALLDEVLAMTQCGGAASTNLPGGGRIRRTSGRLWIDRG